MLHLGQLFNSDLVGGHRDTQPFYVAPSAKQVSQGRQVRYYRRCIEGDYNIALSHDAVFDKRLQRGEAGHSFRADPAPFLALGRTR